ncbi:ficolin-1-like [Physella acuta]|uniref:ficolin-1-like n=1 Tax=Physella acuta TaxID=109671 RepID=UPI0027DB6A36|nr:ficolin-1-like [Physella acuta]
MPNGLVVMCDTETDGGGWTIFQRRVTFVVDFYRNWEDYKNGFGDFDAGDFYLGNENIHCMTVNKTYELRIDMKYLGNSYYAGYTGFLLYSEADFYKISFSGFYGNTSDSFGAMNNNKPFGTYDKAYDKASLNCATTYRAAWWFGGCHSALLNGNYGNTEYSKGVEWLAITYYYSSLNFTEMKIRPRV